MVCFLVQTCRSITGIVNNQDVDSGTFLHAFRDLQKVLSEKVIVRTV